MADTKKSEVISILNQLVNSFSWKDPLSVRMKLVSDKADEIIKATNERSN